MRETYHTGLVGYRPGHLVACWVDNWLGDDDGHKLDIVILASEVSLTEGTIFVVWKVLVVDGFELALGNQMEGFDWRKSLDYANVSSQSKEGRILNIQSHFKTSLATADAVIPSWMA